MKAVTEDPHLSFDLKKMDVLLPFMRIKSSFLLVQLRGCAGAAAAPRHVTYLMWVYMWASYVCFCSVWNSWRASGNFLVNLFKKLM